jgi:septum formation protein
LPRVPGREGEPARVGEPALALAPGGDVARLGGMLTARLTRTHRNTARQRQTRLARQGARLTARCHGRSGEQPPLGAPRLSPRRKRASPALARPLPNARSCARRLRTTTPAHSPCSVSAPPALAMAAFAPPAALRAVLARHRVILGSKSATRQAILKEMGVPYEIMVRGKAHATRHRQCTATPPRSLLPAPDAQLRPLAHQTADIDEKAIRHAEPEKLVMALAHAKAAAIRARLAAATPPAAVSPALPALLITSDQVVVYRGAILEKPESPDEARRFIRGYSGDSARTVGAVVVTQLSSGFVSAGLDTAAVFFGAIPEATVAALVAGGEVFYCAGGLMVESPLVAPHVERMEGGMDSIMGLGRALTARLLIEAAEGGAAGQESAPA